MPFQKGGEFKMNVDPDYDVMLSEGNSNFIALRKVKFGTGQDEECNPEDRKYALMKIGVNGAGDEKLQKAFQFANEDMLHDLTNALVEAGFGDTKEILLSTKKREDFEKIIPFVFSKDDVIETSDGEFYDPREILLAKMME